MKRIVIWLAGAAGMIAGTAGQACAQPSVPYAPRPAFSPFINLNREGVAPAVSYYGLVRPELQYNQSIFNLQGAVGTNSQSIGDILGGGGLPTTGHPTQFLNYGGYFLNNGTALGGPGFTAGTTSGASGFGAGTAPSGPTAPPRSR
jgi:hypothetical protein